MPSEPPATPPPKPGLTGWRKGLVIVGAIAFGLRLLLALLMYSPHHGAWSARVDATPAQKPGQPLVAGNAIALATGDANLAKWGDAPDHDGFVVQELSRDGKPFTEPKLCVLLPEYITQDGQAGGMILLVSQHPVTGSWEVRWTGSDTMPAATKPGEDDGNCGEHATLLMSAQQLQDLVAIIGGDMTIKPSDFEPEITLPGPLPDK
jgi:hypothetical protein